MSEALRVVLTVPADVVITCACRRCGRALDVLMSHECAIGGETVAECICATPVPNEELRAAVRVLNEMGWRAEWHMRGSDGCGFCQVCQAARGGSAYFQRLLNTLSKLEQLP